MHAWVTAIAHLNRERRQKKSRPTEEVRRHPGERAGVFDSVACTEGFKGLVTIFEKTFGWVEQEFEFEVYHIMVRSLFSPNCS